MTHYCRRCWSILFGVGAFLIMMEAFGMGAFWDKSIRDYFIYKQKIYLFSFDKRRSWKTIILLPTAGSRLDAKASFDQYGNTCFMSKGGFWDGSDWEWSIRDQWSISGLEHFRMRAFEMGTFGMGACRNGSVLDNDGSFLYNRRNWLQKNF